MAAAPAGYTTPYEITYNFIYSSVMVYAISMFLPICMDTILTTIENWDNVPLHPILLKTFHWRRIAISREDIILNG